MFFLLLLPLADYSKVQNLIRYSAESDIFVCVKVLWPSQPSGIMSSASVYLTTLLLGRLLTSIVHILYPETDNCLSWISRRDRMTVENISWSNLQERMLQTWRGLNLQPPDHQCDTFPTELWRQVRSLTMSDLSIHSSISVWIHSAQPSLWHTYLNALGKHYWENITGETKGNFSCRKDSSHFSFLHFNSFWCQSCINSGPAEAG